MTKSEFGQLADAIRTYYPKEEILPNAAAMSLWYEQLKDIDYKLASMALQKWVATNKWSPAISDIRGQVVDIVNPTPKTWGEAWQEVIKAVAHFGYYQEAEAMASLDDLTRHCVKGVGYRQLCISENLSVERANFRMIFENEAEKRKVNSQLPAGFKEIQAKVVKYLEGD